MALGKQQGEQGEQGAHRVNIHTQKRITKRLAGFSFIRHSPFFTLFFYFLLPFVFLLSLGLYGPGVRVFK